MGKISKHANEHRPDYPTADPRQWNVFYEPIRGIWHIKSLNYEQSICRFKAECSGGGSTRFNPVATTPFCSSCFDEALKSVTQDTGSAPVEQPQSSKDGLVMFLERV